VTRLDRTDPVEPGESRDRSITRTTLERHPRGPVQRGKDSFSRHRSLPGNDLQYSTIRLRHGWPIASPVQQRGRASRGRTRSTRASCAASWSLRAAHR
jgi:hypothetical protein